jgi:hypothetical protein
MDTGYYASSICPEEKQQIQFSRSISEVKGTLNASIPCQACRIPEAVGWDGN